MNSATIDIFGRTNDERAALRAKLEAATKEAQANWDDPAWRRSMAQAMGETIYRGFEISNVLELFSDVERLGFADRSFVSETRGLKAFWTSRGGYIEASGLHTERMELPRDTVGYHVFEFEDKLRNNFGETQQTLITLAQQKLNVAIQQMVFSTFQNAVPSSSAYYSSGTSLSLTTLNEAIRRVQDESGSMNVSILGRVSMTGAIVDALNSAGIFNGFTPETNEQMLRTGILGVYKGARIITLPFHDDENRYPYLPANELWVVGPGASKFAYWGPMLANEWTDHAWYWHSQARMDFGGLVFRPERLHRIVNTSITANTRRGS